MFTYFPPVCPANTTAQPQTPVMVSLPGCVYTAQTACCVSAPAQAQFPTLSMECLQTATKVATAIIGCNAQAQAMAPVHTFVSLPGCVQTGTTACCAPVLSAYPCPTVAQCVPTWNCATEQAQAQFPTLSLECAKTVTKGLTAALGCNAQAQAVAPVQMSAYPCPTVAQCVPTWNCATEQAQAQFPTLSMSCLKVTTGIATAALGCNAQAQAVAPVQMSAYPCPTVAQCAPTWNCAAGGAQAQFPTLSLNCVTIVTTTL